MWITKLCLIIIIDNAIASYIHKLQVAWLDTGTHDSLSEASTFIEVIEKRTGLKVGCLEGIALKNHWITAEKLRELAQPMAKNQYGKFLLKLAGGGKM